MKFENHDARLQRRRAAEWRLKAAGIVAIAFPLSCFTFLSLSVFLSGLPAFKQAVAKVELVVTQEQFHAAEAELFKTRVYEEYFVNALESQLIVRRSEIKFGTDAIRRIIGKSGGTIREFYRADPDQLGKLVVFEIPTASRVDGYFKGRVTRESVVDSRFLLVTDLDLVDLLFEAGIIMKTFNWGFITGADASVDNPGNAGFGVAIAGSFFMMLVVLFLSLPIGVATALYLEELAPKNRFTKLIEVNISNLAAVPSIVFGILGLAVFIQFMHLPQSAPLVGGLVLTLMTLPTIVINARAALKAVPTSARDASLAVGATQVQTVFHHVLPQATPGILTGTIIGLSQALGETAPLLVIGMVGFIAHAYPESVASGFLDPNSAMPAQIYTWAARADAAFYEKASGGIIIMLALALPMNITAIILRRRFELRR